LKTTISLFLFFICLYNQAQAQNQIIACRSCNHDSIKTQIKAKKLPASNYVFQCLAPNTEHYYGLANHKGKILIPAIYDTLYKTNNNAFIAAKKDSSFLFDHEYHILLALLNTVIKPLHHHYFTLQQNCELSLWKIGDQQLKPFEYDSIYYNQGYYLVQQNNIHQLDTISNTIIQGPIKYWNKNIPVNYFAWTLVTSVKDSIVTLYADSIAETTTIGELCLYKNNRSYKFHFNNIRIEKPQDSTITKQSELNHDSLLTIYAVRLKKKFKADTVVILDTNTYLIRAIHLWGAVDSLGKIILPPTFDSLYYLNHQLFAFQINNKWGVVNQKDKITLQPYYKLISPFKNQIAVIKNFQGQCNFINTSGALINTQWYDSIMPMQKNYKVFAKNKLGLLNEKGKEIIPTKYLQLYDFNKGVILVEDEFKHWYLMNEHQDRVIHNTFYTAQQLPFNQAFIVR
jgi:hypothetical protein